MQVESQNKPVGRESRRNDEQADNQVGRAKRQAVTEMIIILLIESERKGKKRRDREVGQGKVGQGRVC